MHFEGCKDMCFILECKELEEILKIFSQLGVEKSLERISQLTPVNGKIVKYFDLT